jgi:hypothetical protein
VLDLFGGEAWRLRFLRFRFQFMECAYIQR